MRGKLGRRARKLQLRRSSISHHIKIHHLQSEDCTGCDTCLDESGDNSIKLVARPQSDALKLQLQGEELARLLLGAQSWRRPH